MQYKSTTITFRFLKLSMVKIFPNDAVQVKKLTFVGNFGFHKGFRGKKKEFRGCKAL